MNEDKIAYYIDLFDDFLNGKSSAVKQQEIKIALNEFPFLQDVLQQHVQARANIRIEAENTLKEKFANTFEPIEQEKVSLRRYLIPVLLILACAAAAIFFLSKEKKEEIPSLAELEVPGYDIMRTDNGSDVNSLWSQAVTICSTRDYQGCINSLNQIKDSLFLDSNMGKYRLMLGISNMKLEKFAEARTQFSQISDVNPYYDQAIWYKALTYYYEKDESIARENFLRIVNDKKHYKTNEAKLYLDHLD